MGHYGGSYKVSYGLHKKYGDMRLLDTPICENGFLGMGVGAAMTGLRPVVEGMNMGFLLLAFNQISNNCGMLHYTSGGQYKVPMVIRGPGGVGRQLGAEHSQRLESYFQSIPGVQLVAASTARNAKALLKSAIRSDNPIIFFEHVLLYNLKGEVGGPDELQSLERAELVREGTDVTIFCYSRMRYVVLQAVKELEKQGYNPEVGASAAHGRGGVAGTAVPWRARSEARAGACPAPTPFLPIPGHRPHLAQALRHGDHQPVGAQDAAGHHRGGVHEDGRHRRLAVGRDPRDAV